MESSINTAISIITYIDVFAMIRFQTAYRHDEELRKAIANREAVVAKCTIAEAHKIMDEIAQYLHCAMGINNLFLFLLMLPVVIIVSTIEDLRALFKRFLALSSRDANFFVDRQENAPTQYA